MLLTLDLEDIILVLGFFDTPETVPYKWINPKTMDWKIKFSLHPDNGL